MIEMVRVLADAWLIVLALAACGFVASDFDRTRRADWFALILMLPAIVWGLLLAAVDLWGVAGRWPGTLWAMIAGLLNIG